MSAHKHTPGPWKVGQPYGCSIYDNNGKRVAKCFEVWTSPLRPLTECKANGRLISAAPELLEALIEKVMDAEQRIFEDWLDFNSPSGDHEEVQRQWLASNDYRGFIGEWGKQIDAIAKATGEPA